jgi:hypothetical protein
MMKQVMLSAAVISLTFASAFAKPVKNNDNNSNELAKFSNVTTLIPAGIHVNKYKFVDMIDEDDNPDSYDLLLSGKNFKGEVLYDENGKIISYEERLKDTRLPSAVVNAVETKYPDSRFTKDQEIIKDDKTRVDEYKVYFINGKKHGFALVDANGKIIRSHK